MLHVRKGKERERREGRQAGGRAAAIYRLIKDMFSAKTRDTHRSSIID